MATRKKIYAVAVGRRPGIYSDWPTVRRQVEGYPGARYKGFPDRAAAEAWLQSPAAARQAHGPASAAANSSVGDSRKPSPSATSTGLPAVRPATGKPAGGKPDADKPAVDEVVIYTDGGALGNPGPGGYGAVVLQGGRRHEFSGGYRLTTNNRMELLACIVALGSLQAKNLPIRLHSDSSYVVNGISKGWARGWRRRGWRKSDGQPALNADLWARLLELAEDLPVTFHWVRGHSGVPLNEHCDRLAVAAARGPALAVDHEYERLATGRRQLGLFDSATG